MLLLIKVRKLIVEAKLMETIINNNQKIIRVRFSVFILVFSLAFVWRPILADDYKSFKDAWEDLKQVYEHIEHKNFEQALKLRR